MVHRLSITPMTEFDQSPQAKHQTAGCYSLSPRERVRVRGNDGSTAAGCRLSKGLLRKRARAAFTLAEVLAALAFMAIVIPVAVEGLRIANLAGEVGQRKAVAARIADRVLNDWIIGSRMQGAAQSGTARWRRRPAPSGRTPTSAGSGFPSRSSRR